MYFCGKQVFYLFMLDRTQTIEKLKTTRRFLQGRIVWKVQSMTNNI